MRWRLVVMALLVGGLSAVAWFLPQWRQAGKPLSLAPPGEGEIPLTVRHNGPALELRWNIDDRAIRKAGHGKLVITDGTHESRLKLDQEELRSGAALYWPQANRVGFRLETNGGAWGSLEVPAWEVEHDEPLPAADEPGHDAKEHRAAAAKKKTAGHADRGVGAAKAARTKRGKHGGEKIPSYWKMPD